MSKPNEPKMTGSLVDAAVKEFELVLGKKNRADDANLRKGANVRKRNALGRGLSALMSSNALEVEALEPIAPAPPAAGSAERGAGDSAPANPAAAPIQFSGETIAGGLIYVPLAQLERNPKQPRQHFSEEEINDLSRSIRQTGLLQPILVRPIASAAASSGGEPESPRYEIIAGERRYRAAQRAGLHAVPALVRDLDEREVLEVSIVENVQRSQLNAIEEAAAYQRLAQEFDLSQDEIAKTVGKDRTTIANALRLLKLVPKVQDLLASGKLSAGHARALLTIQDIRLQENLAEEIIAHGLSVRAVETRARVMAGSRSQPPEAKPPKAGPAAAHAAIVQALEERFRRKLGTKVKLSMSEQGAGELKISFLSAEELEKLLELIEV